MAISSGVVCTPSRYKTPRRFPITSRSGVVCAGTHPGDKCINVARIPFRYDTTRSRATRIGRSPVRTSPRYNYVHKSPFRSSKCLVPTPARYNSNYILELRNRHTSRPYLWVPNRCNRPTGKVLPRYRRVPCVLLSLTLHKLRQGMFSRSSFQHFQAIQKNDLYLSEHTKIPLQPVDLRRWRML